MFILHCVIRFYLLYLCRITKVIQSSINELISIQTLGSIQVNVLRILLCMLIAITFQRQQRLQQIIAVMSFNFKSIEVS